MPLIELKTNVELDDVMAEDVGRALSALVAELTGKPEEYVLTMVEPGMTLLFGGTAAPAARVTLSSIGLPDDKTPDYSANICSFLESAMDIPGERIYISFENLERHLTGWNSKTF